MADDTGKGGAGGRNGYAFGTFKGVFTPSILTILGVIMYLRFGWVLGNVGLGGTLLIVTMATAITFLTGLSLSALATNMRVRGGGAYYIISRSLGVEVGAAVGLPLFFAQALGISFYIAGFSEAFCEAVPGMDPRTVGVATLFVLTAVAYVSADLALRTQFLVMALIFTSLVSFFLGDAAAAELPAVAQLPAPKPFWVVFAVFFPAVTGIEAGIAMSGDLKDPARSLPRGTIGAVLLGYAVYMAIPLFLSYLIADTRILRHGSMTMVMQHVARWGQPIMLGVWAASLSSAMGALLGAPRTLQALARDRVIPHVFGRGFGKGNDPRIATATSFLVGLIGILVGDLDVIAPVLSMFFLTSYGLLNVSAGLEELTGAPSWRPLFRIPCVVSFFGAFGCFAAMLMINAGATFVAAFVALCVYLLMEHRQMQAWWGDMRSGLAMLVARRAIQSLVKRKPDERTWKPNILVLSGSPASRWHLIELASAIAQQRCFLTVAAVLPGDTSAERRESIASTLVEYLDKRKVQCVVKVFTAPTALAGAETLARAYGYGPIAPNTLLLGVSERPENYAEFASLVIAASGMRQNVVIVREHDAGAELSRAARIDVWWRGKQKNLGLMLALAHLLRQRADRGTVRIVLKTVVRNAAERGEALKRLRQFVSEVRVEADAEVVVAESGSAFDAIRSESAGAGLVLLGIRPVEEGEPVERYKTYYEGLLRNTEDMPPTALVQASEQIDFYAIFRNTG
jgi:solute carrier family 12 (sodium/potassium/chloride transporter), member 2